MYIANELKKLEPMKDLKTIRENFMGILYNVVTEFISDKTMFSIDNFSGVYYDEFSIKTNCSKDIFNTIYLEIDQPLNYKIIDSKIKKKTINKDKIIFPELYMPLETITDSMYDLFINNMDQNNIIWQDQYSINVKAIVNDDSGETINYYFKVIPCITYFNKNNKHGVMYKKNNGIEIEYPELSIKNFNKKNKSTKSTYRDIILIFKNILLKQKNIMSLPKEIIEIILYNVPDKMFVNDTKTTLINIVNYMRNNSIKNFTTIDEQDLAFVSIYRSLSHIYVKHILKLIEKYLALN